MYDAREGKTVTVTEIDMGLLNKSGQFPANGLIYACRTDASASQPNGIRLSNGSEIMAPLSVVSEDPVYIKGDFNTVDKKGVAVMSDAVNLLSNAWNDTKGPGDAAPGAAETHYNVAMVTGIVPTPDGGGTYSGGFEILPRFHENWRGVPAVIRGAFVNIFESEIGTSSWGSSRVYSPPIRDWRFDPDLLKQGNMPPFSPNAVYFRRVLWDDNLPSPLEIATP